MPIRGCWAGFPRLDQRRLLLFHRSRISAVYARIVVRVAGKWVRLILTHRLPSTFGRIRNAYMFVSYMDFLQNVAAVFLRIVIFLILQRPHTLFNTLLNFRIEHILLFVSFKSPFNVLTNTLSFNWKLPSVFNFVNFRLLFFSIQTEFPSNYYLCRLQSTWYWRFLPYLWPA